MRKIFMANVGHRASGPNISPAAVLLTGPGTQRGAPDVLEHKLMLPTIPRSTKARTFLLPGQRFRSLDLFAAWDDSELIVSRLVRDTLGLQHVVLRDQDGREISAYAEQVEAAIAEGHLALVEASDAVLMPA